MIERTILEQERVRFFQRRRREEFDEPRRLLHETDELMFWVEECLLQDLRIVPGWLLPRIAGLLRTADPVLARAGERERRPEAVLELLFLAQQHFMEASVESRAPGQVISLFRRRGSTAESAVGE